MAITIKLKDWKQILIALLLLASVPVGYTLLLQRDLDKDLPRLIDDRLKMDLGVEVIQRNIPADQKADSITRKQGEYLEKDFQTLNTVKVVSLEKRGWGGSLTVRVVYVMERTPMIQSEETRYYRLKHSWIGGWYVRGPSNQAAYNLGWLF